MQEHLGKEGENGEGDWHLLGSAVWGDKWRAVGANPQVEPQISKQGGKSIKAKQISKFNKLYYSKFGWGLDPEKVVWNYMYSSRTLTTDEKQVLTLGLNYSVTPKNLHTDEIIPSTKVTARGTENTRN